MQSQSTKWIREHKAFFRPLVSTLMYATYATILLSVIHRQPKSSWQLTEALLVLSRNTIVILIYLYLLLGHISLSAAHRDAVYCFCLTVSASTFALSFHQTHQRNSYRHVDQHLHVVLSDLQHASTSSPPEPRNARYRATESKKLPKAPYTISPETMSNCSS